MCILLSRSSVFKSNKPLYPCMKCEMNLHDEGESLERNTKKYCKLPTPNQLNTEKRTKSKKQKKNVYL